MCIDFSPIYAYKNVLRFFTNRISIYRKNYALHFFTHVITVLLKYCTKKWFYYYFFYIRFGPNLCCMLSKISQKISAAITTKSSVKFNSVWGIVIIVNTYAMLLIRLMFGSKPFDESSQFMHLMFAFSTFSIFRKDKKDVSNGAILLEKHIKFRNL